jgi:hypothetical protein
MRKYEGVEVQIHNSWRRHQIDVSGELHAPAALFPREIAYGIHSIGGWVGPRVGLDAVENRKIFPWRESNPCRPTRSPRLNLLSYPDSAVSLARSKYFFRLLQCSIISFKLKMFRRNSCPVL